MTKERRGKPRFAVIGTIICVVILSLGYFDDPPNGYTGAPGDDLCTECHSLGSGMQNGSVILSGLPATIIAEQTYTLSVTVSNPNGVADFAGFQSVVLDASNQNAGTLSNASSGSAIETQGGRTYHEHAPYQMFGMSNAVTWTVDWEAPVGSGLITLYAAGNIANGNNDDSGDLIVTNTLSGTLFTPLQVSIGDILDVTCFGGSDGSLTAQASFGEPPYTYQWSNGASGATITGLDPGDYTVTATDNDNATAIATAEVAEPPLFEIIAETVSHVSCNGGNDGQILITVDGGTPPYSGAQGDVYTFPNLEAGDYSINLMDANGCMISEEYTITEPAALIVELNVIIEPECAGGETGLITVEGTGGTGEITYEWNNGSTNNTIQNLEAGVYSVTITDENGCTAAEPIVLDEPDEIAIDLLQLDHVTCAGEADGAISVDASGGTGDLLFEWSNGDSSPELTGLDAGDYTLTVTDENGCTAVDIYTITEPVQLTASISGTTTLTCFGDATGSLQVQAGGGIPGYLYLWSNGSSAQSITNLSAGTYFVTVTDNNSCTATATAVIAQPPQLLPNATATGESAPGEMDGTATAIPTGGTGGYHFVWSTGDTTAMITGLPVGTYTVTVTDDSGCTAMQTVAVTGVNCTLLTNVTTTDALCFGEASGTASVEISGGTSPYEIMWSNGDMGMNMDSVPAGAYSLTVTDTDDCVTEVLFAIGQPDAITVTVDTVINASQGSGGAIQITVTGGTAPYTTIWTLNGGLVSTNEDLSDLTPGEYALQVIDAHDCMLDAGMLTVTVSTGMHDVVEGVEIIVLPNPVRDYLLLDVHGMQSAWTGMLYTSEGRFMQKLEAPQSKDQTVRIETSSLHAGLYYIRIVSALGQRVVPFVKI